jgi:hypothetical protein
VGPRAGLDTEDRGRLFAFSWIEPVVQSVVRHYTDSATSAPNIYRVGNLIGFLLKFHTYSTSRAVLKELSNFKFAVAPCCSIACDQMLHYQIFCLSRTFEVYET